MMAECAYQPAPPLTEQFVQSYLNPGWKDLLWALTNHWLDTQAIADLVDHISDASDDARVTAATAALDNDEAGLHAVLNHGSATDTATDDEVREHWLRVAVAWLYVNRERFADPWPVLEEIWEAFDHPSAIDGLIRWMPPPADGKSGEEGMLARWRDYAENRIRRGV